MVLIIPEKSPTPKADFGLHRAMRGSVRGDPYNTDLQIRYITYLMKR